MPDAVTHPTPRELSAFGLGKLPDPAAAAVARHLEGCEACRQAVAGLPPDSFIGKVRAARPGAPAAHLPDVPPELASHPKFTILRELGRGGMGIVYQARQTVMNRQVVIKVINQALLAHPSALERFRREIQAAAQLAHPNIVTAYDAEQAGSLHLLVMELVPGQTLAEVVRKKGPLPVARACDYVRQAAEGLQHAHEHGMVHRDIKPQNLMLTPERQVKILDFGLAKLSRDRGPAKALTALHAYMGTPEYSAPEQAQDAHSADIRADLYALGCTLYYLLAGRPPFAGQTAHQILRAHLEQEPAPLPRLRPDVPEGLWQVVARLLAKDPARRCQTPAEAAQALAPFCEPGAKATPPERAAAPEAAAPGSPPGHIGRFQVRGLVGAGVFGAVYRAYDPQLDREVALKVPRPGVLESPVAVERFLREARAAARLRHPHIVPIYETGGDGAGPYIAWAFIEGGTLAEAIGRGAIDFRRAAEIVRDLAEALDHAHRLGIVHRDVKPANVLLDEQGRAYLTDFGLAQASETAGRLTQAGALLGTPAYMAPEQARGQHGAARPASDQYSLGVVLYELLCGRTPFEGPPPVVLYNLLHDDPPAPRRLRPEVPPELERICLRALARRPGERYATCRELADDLRRWLDGAPTEARRPGPFEQVVRSVRRKPALALTGAVIAITAAVGVLVLALMLRTPGPQHPSPAPETGPDPMALSVPHGPAPESRRDAPPATGTGREKVAKPPQDPPPTFPAPGPTRDSKREPLPGKTTAPEKASKPPQGPQLPSPAGKDSAASSPKSQAKVEEEDPTPTRTGPRPKVEEDAGTASKPNRPVPTPEEGKKPAQVGAGDVVDLIQAARKEKNPAVRAFLESVAIPHDRLVTSKREWYIAPLGEYLGEAPPRFTKRVDVQPLDAEWKPEGRPWPVTAALLTRVEYYEQIAMREVDRFLEQPLDRDPTKKNYVSRLDMLRLAEAVLSSVQRFHESQAQQGKRDGDGFDQMEANVKKKLQSLVKEMKPMRAVEAKRIRARALEDQAEFGKALELYEQILSAGSEDADLRKHYEKFKAEWQLRSERHKQARDFIYNTWPRLDPLKLLDRLDEANEAFHTCEIWDDTLGPRKLLIVGREHVAKLRQRLSQIPDTSEQDRAIAGTLGKTVDGLNKLLKDVTAYLDKAAPADKKGPSAQRP